MTLDYDSALYLAWWGYFALCMFFVVLALGWCIRSGQFSGGERAESLPLTTGVPVPREPATGGKGNRNRQGAEDTNVPL